jgi:hypothetical protein
VETGVQSRKGALAAWLPISGPARPKKKLAVDQQALVTYQQAPAANQQALIVKQQTLVLRDYLFNLLASPGDISALAHL